MAKGARPLTKAGVDNVPVHQVLPAGYDRGATGACSKLRRREQYGWSSYPRGNNEYCQCQAKIADLEVRFEMKTELLDVLIVLRVEQGAFSESTKSQSIALSRGSLAGRSILAGTARATQQRLLA